MGSDKKQSKLFEDAQTLMAQKGAEHRYGFSKYCPFGTKSAATLVHREALRVCAAAEADDHDGVKEHLRDMAVFGALMYDEERKL